MLTQQLNCKATFGFENSRHIVQQCSRTEINTLYTAYPSEARVFVLLLIFSFLCSSFVDHCLHFCSFISWSLYCISFFGLRILITPLLSLIFCLLLLLDTYALVDLWFIVMQQWLKTTILYVHDMKYIL